MKIRQKYAIIRIVKIQNIKFPMKKVTFLQIFFLFLIFLSAVYLWYVLDNSFSHGFWSKNIFLVLLALIVFGVFFSSSLILFNSNYYFVLISGVALFPFVIPLIFEIYLLPILFLSFILFIYSSLRVKKEKDSSFKIHYSRIISSGLPLFFTGLALVVSSMYYSYSKTQTNEGRDLISKSAIEYVSRIVFGKVAEENETDRINFNMTVDDFIKSELMTDKELNKIVFNNPSILEKEIEKTREEYSARFGMELSGKEKLSEVLAKLVNKPLKPYDKYFPIGFALGLFIAFQSVWFLYAFLVGIFVRVFFSLLKFLRVIKINKIMAEKEVLEL